MVYGLRYQSDFYNYFAKLVSIKIYKQDYADSVEDDLRVSQVIIENKYVDDNTPIVGKGAKIIIIADSSDMSYLEDLLLSYERQFLCTIEYDGTVVFRGYTICDMNERQLLPYAAVTVEFTDYLHRAEGYYPPILKNMGGVTNIFSLVQSLLNKTELDFPLYINSTLFEADMETSADDTWLPQTWVQNSVFFSNSYNYDNIYAAINKALKSFSAYLYSYNDMWIIERQEDMTRDGDWVEYNAGEFDSDESSGAIPTTGIAVPSLKQEYNKQAGNWEYVDESQIIEYNSGLNTLILCLQDKKVDTLVFNDWPAPDDLWTTPYATPAAGTLEYREWYVHDQLTDLSKGEDSHDISRFIHYTNNTYVQGLYYQFAVYFNQDSDNDTILQVKYSMSSDKSTIDTWKCQLTFLIRLDGGVYDGAFMTVGGINSAYDPHGAYSPYTGINIYPSDYLFYSNPGWYCTNWEVLDVSNGEETWSLSKELNLTMMVCRVYNAGGTYTQYDNLYDLLGDVEYQKMIIMFMPARYTSNQNANIHELANFTVYPDNYLGDIQVTVNAEGIDNKITYVLNQNFVKTEEVDLYLFDLQNMNYSNALLQEDGFTRTKMWTSENSPVDIPLYEVFAKGKFRKYGRTIHCLKANILCDEILKPFSLLTDNTILNESDEVITFLLNGFIWDLNKGQYQIEAEEYTEEEVIVDGVTYDSEGNLEGEWDPPPIPTGLSAEIRPLFHHPIRVQWNPVAGEVEGYILVRRPYYASGVLVDGWKIIYVGGGTICLDFLSDIYANTFGCTVYYKVAAYKSNTMVSAYSDEVSIFWHR